MAAGPSVTLRVQLPATERSLANQAEQQQHAVTDARTAVFPGSTSTELNPVQSDKVYDVIVMRFSYKYASSVPGILKLCQAIFVLIALIFLTTAEPRFAGYLLLPLDWHLRIFVFVAVFCFIFSLASYLVHVYRLRDSLRIDWNKFDFILYCLQCFGLLFASSLVASTIGYYDAMMPHVVSRSAKKHLVIAAVLGYVSMLLYGGSAYFAGKQWHTLVLQFSPSRFSSQGSSSQLETPTREAPNSAGSVVV